MGRRRGSLRLLLLGAVPLLQLLRLLLVLPLHRGQRLSVIALAREVGMIARLLLSQRLALLVLPRLQLRLLQRVILLFGRRRFRRSRRRRSARAGRGRGPAARCSGLGRGVRRGSRRFFNPGRKRPTRATCVDHVCGEVVGFRGRRDWRPALIHRGQQLVT